MTAEEQIAQLKAELAAQKVENRSLREQMKHMLVRLAELEGVSGEK